MAVGVPGGGGVLDPDGAFERVAAWSGRIDQLAADTQTMSDRLEGLRVTAADGDGLVEVTVDFTGSLVDLRLGQRTQRVVPSVVARMIMDMIREAKDQLADRAQEIISETVGTDSVAAREIAERVGQRLRSPDPVADGVDDDRGW